MLNETRHKTNYKGFYQNVIKRVVDLLFCVVAIPLVLLITIPVGLLISIEDRGPIFYISKRLGKNFKEFGMFKFRSMKVNAPDLRNEDGSTFNSANDPRVTKIGRWLRESSVDELPQVFNVFLGHMSLLGPRAGDVESKNTYEEDEKDKMLVKPGISGYTQAYYRNGLGVREKRLYDGWYAHNVSFALDVKVLFKTIGTVMKHTNVYTNSENESEEAEKSSGEVTTHGSK
ncbi:MAG: sugar transferase [Ruminococcaceae bacterium]|nr:sugar transferase [Oscillospiraceae bacterium]